MVTPNGMLRDGIDYWNEDSGEERTDIDDRELFEHGPGERQQKEDADGEEDVATNALAGGLLLVRNRFWQGGGQGVLL